MKQKLFIVSILAILFLSMSDDMVTADRGGKGGDGHGRGDGHGGGSNKGSRGDSHGGGQRGGARLGNNSARSPSMSRIDGKPGQGRSKQGNTPQKVQGKPRVQQPINKNSKQQFQNAFHRSNPRQVDPRTMSQRQAQFRSSFPNRIRNQRDASKRVCATVSRDHPHFNNWFNNNFFERHHFQPRCFNDRVNWWWYPRWGAVCNWFPWGWSSPYYYDDSGYYYLLSQEFGTDSYQAPTDESQQPQYYVQPPSNNNSQQINIQNIQQAPSDWLPLGVFAIGNNDVVAGFSNMFIQLAVNKEGDISGTYYNATTDETLAIEGSVDKQTQQAVWRMTDNPNSPLMMSGMYNLTQDKADVQVQFQDGTVQSWVLVRVNR